MPNRDPRRHDARRASSASPRGRSSSRPTATVASTARRSATASSERAVVELYVDGMRALRRLGTRTSGTMDWFGTAGGEPLPEGPHTLRLVARDVAGNLGPRSGSRTVRIRFLALGRDRVVTAPRRALRDPRDLAGADAPLAARRPAPEPRGPARCGCGAGRAADATCSGSTRTATCSGQRSSWSGRPPRERRRAGRRGRRLRRARRVATSRRPASRGSPGLAAWGGRARRARRSTCCQTSAARGSPPPRSAGSSPPSSSPCCSGAGPTSSPSRRWPASRCGSRSTSETTASTCSSRSTRCRRARAVPRVVAPSWRRPRPRARPRGLAAWPRSSTWTGLSMLWTSTCAAARSSSARSCCRSGCSRSASRGSRGAAAG